MVKSVQFCACGLEFGAVCQWSIQQTDTHKPAILTSRAIRLPQTNFKSTIIQFLS